MTDLLSMGGAVVVEVARRRVLNAIVGTVVIDVVEGSAIAALGHMHKLLMARPTKFDSIAQGVDWM
jgi:protein phosphatase methylesterase 1